MRKKGILLIHGLMGSPREFGPVETLLRNHGHRTRLVTLPGHGPSPEIRFQHTTAQGLLEHCMAEYEALAAEVDEMFIVGHSLGGICTLLTAAESPPKLKGIVSLAAPFEHAFFFNHLLGLFRMPVIDLLHGIRYAPESLTGFERPHYRPWMFPRLLRETRQMFDWMRERVGHIDVPVCLLHSPYDLTIPYVEMDKLAARIGKPGLVSTYTLRQCGHQIFPNTREFDPAMSVLLDFIHHQAGKVTVLPVGESESDESIAS